MQIVENEDSFTVLISRDPPEGGTVLPVGSTIIVREGFLISRDPPEGGTCAAPERRWAGRTTQFLISRDPPEGGTLCLGVS